MRSTMMDLPLTVGSILEYGTQVFADRGVATANGDALRRTPYRQVGQRAAQLANALRTLGVHGDDRVGTFLWNNQEHLEAYLAVPSMGAVLHPLNVRLPAEQTAYVAEHAGDRVILVDRSLTAAFADVLPRLHSLKHVVLVGEGSDELPACPGVTVHSYDELLAGQSAKFPWPTDVDESSGAAICYTSGTTGRPKGVVYSHRSIYLHSMNLCMGNVFGLSGSDRILAVVPMFHATAWGLPYAALMVGADLVLPDRHLRGPDLARLVAAEGVTFSGGVPAVWSEVLSAGVADGLDLSSLRLLNCGGAHVPTALMDDWEDQFGVSVVQGWGMTETSPLASLGQPAGRSSGAAARERRSTLGRFFCLVQVRAVGPDDEVLARDGATVGEIEVRGPYVSGSYYREDDASRFHDGWLRTGDMGTLDDEGRLILTDRLKDVIKSGGEWISPVEIEDHLKRHPAVADVAVVGVPDVRWQERPLVLVIRRDDSVVTGEQLQDHLVPHLARWQIPDLWAFVDALPLTSVGKVDKKEIRRRHQDNELDVRVLR